MGSKLKVYSNNNHHSTYPVINNLLWLKYVDKECEDAIKIMKKAREQWLAKKRDIETELEYKEKST